MMEESHFRKLEHLYLTAPLQKGYPGIDMKVEKGKAVVTLPMTDQFFHGANFVHGSFYFRLLDDAAFFAVQSEIRDFFVVTSQFNLQLLRPSKETVFRAEGRIRSMSRQLFVAEAELFNSAGKTMAFGTGNFMRSSMRLEEVEGYKLP